MATMKSELVLSLIDHLSGPVKGAGDALDDLEAAAKKAGKGGSKEMQELGKSLKEARDQASKFDLFEKLRKDLPATRQAFRQAQGDVERLAHELDEARQAAAKFDGVKSFQKNGPIAREMADAKKKVQELERQLTTAQRTVSRTSDAFQKQAVAVKEAKKSLQGMGLDLKSVGSAQTALKTKIDNTTSALKRQIDTEARAAHRREKFARGYQVLAATGAGGVMAGQMLARPLGKAMTYDEQITYTGLTLAGGGTVDEKRAAKQRVSDTVYEAQRYGGGKRDDVAEAYGEIVGAAGDKLTEPQMAAALKHSAKTAHATGARAVDAGLAAVAMLNNGVKETEIAEAFDVMVRGGELGGFEFPDMSKWFPAQLSMGSSVGLQGLPGIRTLAAWNQAARTVSATPDEAGNNIVNILQKLGSKELVDRLAKDIEPQREDPVKTELKGRGKKARVERKFDWNEYKLQKMKEGIDPLNAVVGLIDRELGKDQSYKAIKTQLDKAGTPDEAKDLLGKLGDIAVASKFGEFFSDRQAFMGAYAIYRNQDKIKADLKELENAAGTVDSNSQVVREQAWSKAQEAKNELDRANENAYGALEGPLGTLTGAVNDAARAFPNLTAGLYAATEILMAIGGAGIVSGAVAGVLAGKAAGAAAGGAATGSGAGAAAGAGALGAVASRLLGLAPPVLATTGATSTSPQEMAVLQTADEITKAMRAKHGDDVVSAARSQNRSWWRASGLDVGDSQDPEYIRKYLESPEGQAYLAKTVPKAPAEAAPNLPEAPLPPQHPMRAPLPPQSPTLDSITSEWPESARKSITDFIRVIAQGGVDAKAEAARVGEAIQQELSVTGTPKINTAELDIAISKAQQLGIILRNIPGAVPPAGGKTPEGRAVGGPVAGGTPYIVGEKGPEMFVPRSSGSILTAARTADMFQPRSMPARSGGSRSGGGGPASVTFGDINIQGGANATPQQIRREFSREASAIMRRHFSDGIT